MSPPEQAHPLPLGGHRYPEKFLIFDPGQSFVNDMRFLSPLGTFQKRT
jgi:hypothetical protein